MEAIVDPLRSSMPDAVLAVSRLLRGAGGSTDPAAVREAVLEEARRFLGADAAVLVALEDADRRARLYGSDERHEVASLPALAELIATRAHRAPADAATLAALAPGAAQGQLVAVGGEVMLLTGAPDTDGPLAELFASAAATVLDAARTASAHQSARGAPGRAHARGQGPQRVARPGDRAEPDLRGGGGAPRRRHGRRLPRLDRHRLRRRRRRRPPAGVRRLGAGARRRAGRPGHPPRAPDAHRRLPGDDQAPARLAAAQGPGRRVGPVRLGRRAARRAHGGLGAPAQGRARRADDAGDVHRARRRRVPQRQRARRASPAPRRPTR